MTTWVKWLIALVLVVVGVYYGLYTPGQAVFVYGTWSVELPLALFAALAVVSFLSLHWLLQLAALLRFLPSRWRKRHARRAHGAFEAALIAISLGRWEDAERAVLRHSRHASTPYLHHLLAAFAAHVQGIYTRRDDQLAQARAGRVNDELQTVLSATARLRIAAQQWGEARATLEELHGLAPHHSDLLRLLAGVCERQSDWVRVGTLLAGLEQHKALDKQALAELQARYHAAQIGLAKDAIELAAAWEAVPARARLQHPVALAYARQCSTRGWGDSAEEVLRRAIDQQWSAPLVALYGTVVSTNAAGQLKHVKHAEGWLRAHHADPALLITLAQLCMQLKLWDQAQFHAHHCLELAPCAEAYALLMQIYQQQGDTEKLLALGRAALDAWKISTRVVANLEPPVIAL